MDAGKYCSSVRMGNWNEEICLEEDKVKLFLKKRERGELLVQKARKLFCNLLKEVELAPVREHVQFGDVVQILAAEYPLALTSLLTQKQVDLVQQLVSGCPLVATPLVNPPVVKTTFVIRSEHGDNSRDGEPLKFNQDFMLCVTESYANLPLFVESQIPQIGSKLGSSEHPVVMLSDMKNRYCRWRVLYWDPSRRPESEGSPFSPHCRVLINHSASNQNLAVENKFWFPTYFGMECEVSVHTYINIQKCETQENFWVFGTQNPDTSSEKSAAQTDSEENINK